MSQFFVFGPHYAKQRTPRMLTSEELADCCGGCRANSAIETWMQRAILKFCDVNGIALPRGVPVTTTLANLDAEAEQIAEAAYGNDYDAEPAIKALVRRALNYGVSTVASRVLLESDAFCPKCGHNRDASSVSSIDHGTHQSCQMCGAEWIETAAGVTAIDGPRRGPEADGSQTPNAGSAIRPGKAGSNTDTRKLCTCDGAGRGPGRACVVKAGGRLGELWRCAEGHEPTPGVAERHPRCGYPYCACVGECFAASQPGAPGVLASDETKGGK